MMLPIKYANDLVVLWFSSLWRHVIYLPISYIYLIHLSISYILTHILCLYHLFFISYLSTHILHCCFTGISASPVAHITLQWCHNECNSISNHQRLNCTLKCLFRWRSKNTSKLCVTGLCEGNPPVTGAFPSQKANNTENFSIWWRHHGKWDFTSNFQCQWSDHEVTLMLMGNWPQQRRESYAQS